jgi:hypothetical protein
MAAAVPPPAPDELGGEKGPSSSHARSRLAQSSLTGPWTEMLTILDVISRTSGATMLRVRGEFFLTCVTSGSLAKPGPPGRGPVHIPPGGLPHT